MTEDCPHTHVSRWIDPLGIVPTQLYKCDQCGRKFRDEAKTQPWLPGVTTLAEARKEGKAQ